MMPKSQPHKGLYFLVIFITFISCKRERQDFRPNPELNITVLNDLNEPVLGATIDLYGNETDYENAVNTKIKTGLIDSYTTDIEGKSLITVEPKKAYYILISYFDINRNMNLNNVGVSGYLEPLNERVVIFLKAIIKPIDGNIIFYSTNSNLLPIEIDVTSSTNQNSKRFVLTANYSLNTDPNVLAQGATAVLRDPGQFNYYAKNPGGCVWSGTAEVKQGNLKLINLSKCESGRIAFYATAVNDTLLPLKVKLNNIDSLGFITANVGTYTCGSAATTSVINVVRSKGRYSYSVESKAGHCIWTGFVQLQTDGCEAVNISACEQ